VRAALSALTGVFPRTRGQRQRRRRLASAVHRSAHCSAREPRPVSTDTDREASEGIGRNGGENDENGTRSAEALKETRKSRVGPTLAQASAFCVRSSRSFGAQAGVWTLRIDPGR
jgi:hypothetical protein